MNAFGFNRILADNPIFHRAEVLSAPVENNDITNKAYVDSGISGENHWDSTGTKLTTHDPLVTDIEVNSVGYNDLVVNNTVNGINTYPTYVDNLNGTLNLSSYTVKYYGKIYTMSATTNISFTDVILNYIIIDYNSGTPVQSVINNPQTIDSDIIIVVGQVFRNGNTLTPFIRGINANNCARNIQRFLIQKFGINPVSGGAVTCTLLKVNISLLLAWLGTNYIQLSAFNSATTNFRAYYVTSGVWTLTPRANFDNVYYNNSTSGLVAVGSLRYGFHDVYITVNGTSNPIVSLVYGKADYATRVSAENAAFSTIIPPELMDNKCSMIIGRIIFRQGGTTSASILSYTTKPDTSSYISSHNQLSDLTVDDHTQYALLAGRVGDSLSIDNIVSKSVGNVKIDGLSTGILQGYQDKQILRGGYLTINTPEVIIFSGEGYFNNRSVISWDVINSSYKVYYKLNAIVTIDVANDYTNYLNKWNDLSGNGALTTLSSEWSYCDVFVDTLGLGCLVIGEARYATAQEAFAGIINSYVTTNNTNINTNSIYIGRFIYKDDSLLYLANSVSDTNFIVDRRNTAIHQSSSEVRLKPFTNLILDKETHLRDSEFVTTTSKNSRIGYKSIGYGDDIVIQRSDNGRPAVDISGENDYPRIQFNQGYYDNYASSNLYSSVTGSSWDITAGKDGYMYFRSANSTPGTLISVSNILRLSASPNSIGAIFSGFINAASVYSTTVTSGVRTLYIDSNGLFGGISSTRRSKVQVPDLNYSNILYKLKPISFKYKKKNEEGQYFSDNRTEDDICTGFFAEDVEQIEPELCQYNGNELAGVSYEKIMPIAVKVIQDQKTLIDELTSKVYNCENQIESLLSRIIPLENKMIETINSLNTHLTQ